MKQTTTHCNPRFKLHIRWQNGQGEEGCQYNIWRHPILKHTVFLFHFLRRANFAPPLPIFFPAHRINAYMFKLGVRTRKCVANQYSGYLGHVAWHCGFCWNEVWGSERQAKKKRKNLVSQYDTFSSYNQEKQAIRCSGRYNGVLETRHSMIAHSTLHKCAI